MNFSTVPPYRSMSWRASSKYRERSSRTSSGSRDSESVVNPTRSAKSTETRRRSAAGVLLAGPGAGVGPGTDVSVSAAPHSPQNFTVGPLAAPQEGHIRASGLPHSPQNLRPASFSEPQDEQTNDPPLDVARKG